MSKMFVVGNSDSYWFHYYVAYIALPLGFDVSIQMNPMLNCKYEQYYRENKVSIVGNHHYNRWIMKIPKLRSLYMLKKRQAAIKEQYDIVVVISATESNLRLAQKLVKRNGKIIALVIGSDVLRVSNRQLKRVDRLLFKLRAQIVCSAVEPYKKIAKHFKKASCVPENVIGFGLATISCIKSHWNEGVEGCKQKLGIDSSKLTVCLGYNARVEQQHIEVIQALAKIDNNAKAKIHIVLPMTYLGNDQYCNQVATLLKENQFTYTMLREFRDSDDMAELWIACDMFINAQTTDAMSASILECLYAGVHIVNASWLNYSELQRLGVELETFTDFNELPNRITNYLIHVNKKDCRYRYIYEKEDSVKKCREKWRMFLFKE